MKRPVERRKLSAAERAWLGLGIYVLAADTVLWRTKNDTMSIQFSRWLRCKPGMPLCFLGTAGVVAHLWWGMPLPLQQQMKRYLGGVAPAVLEPFIELIPENVDN